MSLRSGDVVKFDRHPDLQRHRAVLPAIARLSCHILQAATVKVYGLNTAEKSRTVDTVLLQIHCQCCGDKKAVLPQGEPRDATVNFDTSVIACCTSIAD